MTVKVTISGNMAKAAMDRAGIEGMATKGNPGVSTLMRKALRYYLSQQGYKQLSGGLAVEVQGSREDCREAVSGRPESI